MTFIDGVTFLYSEYCSQIAVKILVYISAIALLACAIAIAITMIVAHYCKFSDIVLLVVVIGMCIGNYCLANSINPITNYYVQIDDNVPYTLIGETYGYEKVSHEGGDVYKICIENNKED